MIGRRSHDDAQSFEEAWNGGTPKDAHIADLVAFAEGLCEAAVVEPTMQFRTDLRAQLMTEAATVLVPMPGASRPVAAPVRQARPGRRRIATVTAGLIASAGAVSLVASSASAVPGEMLYPVKRTVESVELNLHRGDASRGSFQLAQASERLAEARQLSAAGRSEALISDALDDFSSAAADGSTRLFSDFTDTGKETSIRTVNDFAAAASVDLSEISAGLPDSVADSLTAATEAVSKVATEATSLCKACTTADVEALVSAVTGLAKTTPTEKAPAEKPSGGTKPSPAATAPAGGTTSAGAPAASKPSKAPAPAATTPAPAATTKTPSLTDLTDPIVGGLLGDENQVGLVPGLLKGLLGGGQ